MNPRGGKGTLKNLFLKKEMLNYYFCHGSKFYSAKMIVSLNVY